jgi:hypothetical protein
MTQQHHKNDSLVFLGIPFHDKKFFTVNRIFFFFTNQKKPFSLMFTWEFIKPLARITTQKGGFYLF